MELTNLKKQQVILEYDPLTGGIFTKICTNYKVYAEHRLAWLYVYGKFPALDIDHIDQDRTNNKISNLRSVTRK